ncbi:I78 family peptidase inhibitor [Sphingopyxis sp. 550A]
MDIRLIAIAAAALPLAACAASEAPAESTPPPPAEMTCNADAGASFVGQTATPDLGGAIVKATGARTLRWGPPRSAMTMDYRQDRVNVMYDDAYKITQVTCG